MPRVALGIVYDGSRWLGWQTQRGGRTVQDTLEAALAQFLAQPVGTICAGRTDTGVHALGQVVHLDTPVQRRMESWVRGLNARSEEHTSELQSLMRISYAVFRLKKKKSKYKEN